METKEDRKARQLKQWKQMIKELKLDVQKSYRMKVEHDAYYQTYDFKEDVLLA